MNKKDCGGSDRDLFHSHFPAFSWSDGWKSLKETSIRTWQRFEPVTPEYKTARIPRYTNLRVVILVTNSTQLKTVMVILSPTVHRRMKFENQWKPQPKYFLSPPPPISWIFLLLFGGLWKRFCLSAQSVRCYPTRGINSCHSSDIEQ